MCFWLAPDDQKNLTYSLDKEKKSIFAMYSDLADRVGSRFGFKLSEKIESIRKAEGEGMLKPCPFCGSDVHVEYYSAISDRNRTGIPPEGSYLVKIFSDLYEYEKDILSIKCHNENCLCRNLATKCSSLNELIDLWNTRCEQSLNIQLKSLND